MSEFDKISHVPIKASNDFYTLGDIIANDQNLHGEHVNIQAVVKSVSITNFNFRLIKAAVLEFVFET